jgi:porin
MPANSQSKAVLCLLSGANLLLAAATEAYAQTTQTGIVFRNPDDIPNLIRDVDPEKESLFKSPLPQSISDAYFSFKDRLSKEQGFDFSLAYAYLGQAAFVGDDHVTGSGGQAEFDFTWTAFGREGSKTTGVIGGKIEDRYSLFNNRAPQFVAPDAGSLWTGALGYGELDLSVSQLWYEHRFNQDRILARFGKISPFTVFDYYKYKSPRVAFLGQIQNFNPTIAFPPSALGFGAGARMKNGGYFGAGIFDANGRADKSGFDTLFDEGELFTVAEFGWTPDFDILLRPGQDYRSGDDDYHLTLWHSDPLKNQGRPEGWGFTASAAKGFGDIVPFARYGYSDGGATLLKHMASVGVGFENVGGYENDLIGLSAAFGRPSDPVLRDQYAFEAFFRLQLTPGFALTPNLQFIVDPALAPTDNTIFLASIRARVAF